MMIAGDAIAANERAAAEREHRRNRRPDRAGDDVRDRADGPFGRNSPVASVSSLPSRAAIAAPSSPTQSVRFGRTAPGRGCRAEKPARRDLGERQQHDAAERERGDDVLGPRGEPPRIYLPLDFRNASRSCTAMS